MSSVQIVRVCWKVYTCTVIVTHIHGETEVNLTNFCQFFWKLVYQKLPKMTQASHTDLKVNTKEFYRTHNRWLKEPKNYFDL